MPKKLAVKLLDRVYQRAAQQSVPLIVHFDLTYRCHQRCLHCYLPEAWREGGRASSELDTVRVKDILDQLADAGTFFLTFSGGEIFFRQDLMELLDYARRRNFAVTLLTTGTWGLEPEQCRSLGELGLEAIFVSLYSLDAQVHDHITQTPGSWARMMRAVADLRTDGLRVGFNCPVCNLNYQEVPALKAYAHREGMVIRFEDELSPRWDGRAHQCGLALPSEGEQYLQKNRLQEARGPRTTRFTRGFRCNAGIISCYIGAGGEVWPCVDVPWPCGNLQEGERFEHLWRHSETLAAVRRLSLLPGTEKLCDIWQKRPDHSEVCKELIL